MSLKKVASRNIISTIDGRHRLQKDMDLPSLYAVGLDSIDIFIATKFTELPARGNFRTDKKQDDVENLNEEEQDNLLINIAEQSDEILLPYMQSQL